MSLIDVTRGLTNVRSQKSISPVLAAKTTKGVCMIAPQVATEAGLADGDYVYFFENAGTTYFTKGLGEGADDFRGSKLSGSPGKPLSFSSQNLWDTLGGNDSEHQIYSIGGITPGDDAEVKQVILDSEIGEQNAYPIAFSKSVPKQQKSSNENEDEMPEDEDEV